MNKIPLYLVVAVFLGLFIMLIPLLVFVEFNDRSIDRLIDSFSRGFQGFEGSHGSAGAELSFLELEVPTISFVVAIAAYLLVRRKIG